MESADKLTIESRKHKESWTLSNSTINVNQRLAGEVFSLLSLYRLDTGTKSLEKIRVLMEAALSNNEYLKNDLSYFSGMTGYTYLLLKIADITEQEVYVNKALAYLENLDPFYLESTMVGDSLYLGRAGILFTLLYTYTLSGKEELVPIMEAYANRIISNALLIEEGLCWQNPHQLVSKPLTSYGHGTAGIGYVFKKMGEVLDRPAYIDIAKKAFHYVNGYGTVDRERQWKDFRNEIFSADDFKTLLDQYETTGQIVNGDGVVDHSIEHGTIGMLMPQLNFTINPTHFEYYLMEKWNGQAPLLDYAIANSFVYCKGVNATNKEAQELQIEKSIADLGENYQKTYLSPLMSSTPDTCFMNFLYPDFEDRVVKKEKIATGFSTFGNFNQIIFQNNFEKTALYLGQVKEWEAYVNQDEQVNCYEDWVSDFINDSTLSEIQQEFVSQTMNYERKLLGERFARKFNVGYFLQNHISQKKVLSNLNKSDLALLKNELVMSKEFSYEKAFAEIENINSLTTLPPVFRTFWKFDLEEGVSEISLQYLSIILNRFNKPKRVDTALMEILHYCKSAKEKDLIPLIKFSGSRNKKTLMKRIPLIFLFELRILIRYGLLDFRNTQKTKRSLKNRMLRASLWIRQVAVRSNLLQVKL